MWPNQRKYNKTIYTHQQSVVVSGYIKAMTQRKETQKKIYRKSTRTLSVVFVVVFSTRSTARIYSLREMKTSVSHKLLIAKLYNRLEKLPVCPPQGTAFLSK
jgi:hypothetical protein